MNTRSGLLSLAVALPLLAACNPAAENPQDEFFASLAAHCGNAYEGRVSVGDPELDADWMAARIVIEVKECSTDRIRVPLHVDNDHSRTWVFSRSVDALELKHDHRLADGSHDSVTGYGGSTFTIGTANNQVFPADDYSKVLFSEHDMPASVGNTWVVSFPNTSTLRYQLLRDERDFQVEVDLSKPIATPPAPWGWLDNEEYSW